VLLPGVTVLARQVPELELERLRRSPRRSSGTGDGQGACPSTADDKSQRQGGYPLLATLNE